MSSGLSCKAVVASTLALAQGLGTVTTAEGVETEEQMRCLNLEGCVEVQGYLYSRPVPTSEIAKVQGGASCPGCNLFQADLSGKELQGKTYAGARLRQAEAEAQAAKAPPGAAASRTRAKKAGKSNQCRAWATATRSTVPGRSGGRSNHRL